MSPPLRLVTAYLAIVVLVVVGANLAFAAAPRPATPTGTSTAAGSGAAVDARLAASPEPTIVITVAAPNQVSASPTLVSQVNRTTDGAHLIILRIPDEVTDEAFTTAMRSSVVPDWFFTALVVGGDGRAAPGGGSALALGRLLPGRYAVIDPFHPRQRTTIVASGGATPHATPRVAMGVDADMRGVSLAMPTDLRAGASARRGAGSGSTDQGLVVVPVPEGATPELVLLAFQRSGCGSPFPSGLGAAWDSWSSVPVDGVGATSPAGLVYSRVDLTAGTYAAVRLVPSDDPTPRLALGTTSVFTVTEPPA